MINFRVIIIIPLAAFVTGYPRNSIDRALSWGIFASIVEARRCGLGAETQHEQHCRHHGRTQHLLLKWAETRPFPEILLYHRQSTHGEKSGEKPSGNNPRHLSWVQGQSLARPCMTGRPDQTLLKEQELTDYIRMSSPLNLPTRGRNSPIDSVPGSLGIKIPASSTAEACSCNPV